MDQAHESSKRRSDDVYSKSLRAGNRTYFFDVKSTKSDNLYLTITESKRRFNKDNGKFYYEKHKLFLYPEDFSSFSSFLEETLDKVRELSGVESFTSREELQEKHQAEKQKEEDDKDTTSENKEDKKAKQQSEEDASSEGSDKKDQAKGDSEISSFSDVNFEDLGKEGDKE